MVIMMDRESQWPFWGSYSVDPFSTPCILKLDRNIFN